MTNRMLLVLSLSLALPGQVGAIELEVGAARENLDQGMADWESAYVEAEHRFDDRRVVYGALRRTERFGLTDRDWLAGFYHPLNDVWTLNGETGASSTRRVLPERTVAVNLHRRLDGGWGLGLGGRRTEYVNADAIGGMLGVERYFGSYRAAYSFALTQVSGASAEPGHRVQLNRYYGGRNNVGVALGRGREAENVPPRGVLTTDISSLALAGRHWLDRDWAVSYEAVLHDQGTVYRRQGLRLGLRRAF
jgi:YaiO family outer membrane protein